MLHCRINSDIQDLNELHKKYWWIPDGTMIRPNQKVLEDKRVFSDYVLRKWTSFRDFILDTHFKYPINIKDGCRCIHSEVKKSEWNFQKSLFPYDLLPEVNHYILWNSLYDYFNDFNESMINTIIKETLESMLATDKFDFAWYKNPKPSIPELWHCQVFWIQL